MNRELSKENIAIQEQILNNAPYETRVVSPTVTKVLIRDRKTTAIKWWSDEDEQKQRFFPIADPKCEGWEYSSPSEWQVVFIGTFEDLKNSEIARVVSYIPSGSPKIWVALLAVNDRLYGFGGRPLWHCVFPCEIVLRVEGGKVIHPRPLCRTNWRPRMLFSSGVLIY